KLRRKLGAEVLVLEHLSDFDLAFALHWIRAALHPLDRFFLRLALPEPKTGNQFLRLGERPLDDRAILSGEPNTRALRARLEALASQHDAGFDQLFVVLPHIGQKL